jgi:hypothetical protein
LSRHPAADMKQEIIRSLPLRKAADAKTKQEVPDDRSNRSDHQALLL